MQIEQDSVEPTSKCLSSSLDCNAEMAGRSFCFHFDFRILPISENILLIIWRNVFVLLFRFKELLVLICSEQNAVETDMHLCATSIMGTMVP